MKMNSRKALDVFVKPEDIPRISRQEFFDCMDEILDRVSKEDMAFVICEEGKHDIFICPAEWFGLGWDKDFAVAIKAALRASLRECPKDAEAVGRTILKNIWRIDTDALQDMCGILDDAGPEEYAMQQLHAELLAEIQGRGGGTE